MRQRSPVRGITEDGDYACARLADGTSVRARVLVGADGSSGVSARYAWACRYEQVDLGLELEIAVPPPVADQWRGRMLLDWGPIPGSYGWVFPKGDRLTVGRDRVPRPGRADPVLPARLHRQARTSPPSGRTRIRDT